MAARLRLRHQDEVREKIRASQLVNRLTEHVLGKVEMSSTQVTAALGLLKKVLADKTESKSDVTIRAAESLSEEQARLMAEEALEAARGSAGVSAPLADPVHPSVSS